jgi:signal peptidase I
VSNDHPESEPTDAAWQSPAPAEPTAAFDGTEDADPARPAALNAADAPAFPSTFPPAPVFPPVHAPVIVRRKVPLRHTVARVGEELVAWFKTLVSAAVYATLIVTFGFQVARVEGHSMAPTLEDQDRLIVNKLEYRLPNHDPAFGDIVMLLFPNDPDKSFVKRVVGEPGDTIRSVNGHVYRNDEPLPDEFIPEEYRSYDTWGPEIVPEGYYFVMGDHRNNSSDSRTWRFVPKKYIIGKVQLRWWPLTEMRLFSAWN